MVNLANLLVTYPKGLWESLIKTFTTGVGSYVWGIILLTLVIKLVLLPFDFLQRYTTSSFSRAQAYLEPQKQKLEKRYAKNPKVLNEALNKLYKENNVKMGSSCLLIFITFGLNIAVLLTFWNGMNAVANYQVAHQYDQYKNEYQTVYSEVIADSTLTLEDAKLDYNSKLESNNDTESESEEETEIKTWDDLTEKEQTDYLTKLKEEETGAVAAGQQAVLDKYDDINTGFLWVKNIWKADSPLVKSVPSFDEWVSLSKTKYANTKEKAAAKVEYETIMKLIVDKKQQVNGYFILPILVIALMLLSQYITRRSQMPPKEKLAQMSEEQKKSLKTGKAMMIALPVIYAIFVISTASLFAFYIFMSSLISTLTTPLITKIVNVMEKKKDKKKEEAIAVDYRRK